MTELTQQHAIIGALYEENLALKQELTRLRSALERSVQPEKKPSVKKASEG